MQVITEKKNKMMTPSVADPEKQCFGSGAGAIYLVRLQLLLLLLLFCKYFIFTGP